MKPETGHLITKEQALELLFQGWMPEMETETIPLDQAAGRVLAEDRYAQYDIPVVRASGMDGVAIPYALVKDGLPDTAAWREGREFVRADTGDDFDDRYDTVIPIERVRLLPEGGLRFDEELELQPGMNVRPRGSQLQQGTLLARAGTVLNALDLAALGMGGYGTVAVRRRPRVAFVPTGSELVPVGSPLGRGQNFDTNSLMAAQLLREMGAEPVISPILRDELPLLRQKLEELLKEADVVILNAGTSKGGEDYCAALLEENGALFHGVAAVPGRPMSMAIVRGKPVLNLSGPAQAAFYGLDWAVRPILCRFLGIPVPQRERVEVTLNAPLRTPPSMSMLNRLVVQETEAGEYLATPLSGRGPQAVSAAEVLTANALYISVPGEPAKEAGDTVSVELLRGRETLARS